MKPHLLSGLALLVGLSPLLHAQALERRAYLQNASPTAITVCWRTTTPTNSVVRFGTQSGDLTETVRETGKRTDHQVRLSGLAPDTKYFYSIGSSDRTLAGSRSHFFKTYPTTAKPTRIWVLGDAGTGGEDQKRVRDAYFRFTGDRHTDLWLTCGDNAYESGSDSQYTGNFFAIYPSLLRNSVLWPSLGNHDAKSSSSADQSGPFFDQFDLPKRGEAGGVPSRTEAYYSFNFGNIHFVGLDSADSNRDANGAMAKWVTRDLRANTRDWTIVYFHHAPYSKGRHNSDSEDNMSDMRQVFNPIFEAHGVDLVLAGHSHAYERSKFIDGHYGDSSTFNRKTMVVQRGGGKGGDAYTKSTLGPVPREGTVYIVAGSSGKLDSGPLDYPAMWISRESLGSLVLDIDGNRLTSTFLDDTGNRHDRFSIIKGESANLQPMVTITRPSTTATFTAPATFSIQADVGDTGGPISHVEFFRDSTLLGTDRSSPYRHVWRNAPGGTHGLTAVATDLQGNRATSPAVEVKVLPVE